MNATSLQSWCLAVCLLLAGCADPDAGVDREPVVIESVPIADKVAYAQQFPIFSVQEGQKRLPMTPQGRMPFGVLLAFINHRQLEMCTVSHWRAGQVLTNAHCLANVPNPDAYYVVFYDRYRLKRQAQVQSFGFRGNPRADDVAVLNLDETEAADWDELAPTVESTQSSIDAGLTRGNFPVTVWSFDPLTSHPELGYGDWQGGVFVPKNCTGFRTEPEVRLISNDGSSQPYPATTVDTRKHLLFDRCDNDAMPGNSGSWISAPNDPTRGYGVFHWLITLRDQPIVKTLRTFEYTGSDGHRRLISAQPNFNFYFVATDLWRILQNHPNAFAR